MLRMHCFAVRCATRPGECLALTGSSPELGGWRRSGIKLMEQQAPSDLWTASVELSQGEHFYRYCVVVVLQHGRLVVRRWETHLHPRRVREGQEEKEDIFGRQEGGAISIQRGWLTEEMVIQFKLRAGGLAVWKRKYAGHRLWLKMTPLDQDLKQSQDLEESIDMHEVRGRTHHWPIVETAELTSEGCERKVQDQFGIEYREKADTFIIFEIQLFNLNSVAFLVDIYGRSQAQSDDDIPLHLGMCYIYSDNLKQTEGKIEATITSMKFDPFGRIQMDYLLIHPVEGVECDFSVSYQNHWDRGWDGLDVGHRGLGNSYTSAQHCSDIRENTIASMRDALLHGADMVEFDVQVSADLVPVIYHEFTLCVQTKTRHGGEIMLEVPVHDLTLDQLQGLKVHHPSEKSSGVKNFVSEGEGDHAAFPTLEAALTTIDSHCGFNIEIKFSQQYKDGGQEQKNKMEMNLFIDQVLKTVLQHAGHRKIVFSSFNPDVCTMLVNKQNKYPAMLLTQGINTKYKDYQDPRTWTIPLAACFVKMAGLLGISAMAEDIMRDPTQVHLVKSQGQILFCWTDERNDRDTLKYLKSIGINGVIYDRMDQHNSKQVKESVFLLETKKGKSDSGYSGGSSPISSPSPTHS